MQDVNVGATDAGTADVNDHFAGAGLWHGARPDF
ncbi:hypothetical protein X734_05720 [Mesorhizobium sp. L2C084A000]|nr:hypothetical protein X734_05720 [Mesorhizobium sp. L2C084A000]